MKISSRGCSEVKIKLESYVGKDGEEIGVGCCYARGIEKGCYCADGGGCCCRVGAACVVLGSATYGDVLED